MGGTSDLLQALGLEDIATAVVGWDPRTQHVPAIPTVILVYGTVYLISQLLYNASKILPEPWRQGALEFIKTMALCAYPFGHEVLRKTFGERGYLSGAIPIIALSLLTFREADGNPVTSWVKYFNKMVSLRKCLTNNVIQICAGLAALRLGMLIVNLELHPIHVERLINYRTNVCRSTLNVPVYVGIMTELCGVLYITLFASFKLARNSVLDTLIKVVNMCLIVSSGVHLTGMFMHPAIATSLTFGCGATPRTYHVLVYWVGPLIGTCLSAQIQSKFHSTKRQKPKTQPKTAKQDTLNTKDTNWNTTSDNQTVKRRQKFFHS